MISAVVLSDKQLSIKIDGVKIVNHVSKFSDAKGLLKARLDAIEKVKTEWFFYLDFDDELPTDYARILERCMAVNTPIAYTDEKITNADGSFRIRKSSEYSEDKFIDDNTLIHHLAVCKTQAAIEASKEIPRGFYSVESLLFFQVAKKGATYIDEVGYIWHKRNGLSSHPTLILGLVQSAIWTNRNKSK